MIRVRLYGSEMEFNSKDELLNHFHDAILFCEGAERDRYVQICIAAKCGDTYINSDEF